LVGIIAKQRWELVEGINPAPGKEEIYAINDKYKLRQTWVVWGQKVPIKNSKLSGIFSLTIRPALDEGAFGFWVPPS
jgi:hypothetical protein